MTQCYLYTFLSLPISILQLQLYSCSIHCRNWSLFTLWLMRMPHMLHHTYLLLIWQPLPADNLNGRLYYYSVNKWHLQMHLFLQITRETSTQWSQWKNYALPYTCTSSEQETVFNTISATSIQLELYKLAHPQLLFIFSHALRYGPLSIILSLGFEPSSAHGNFSLVANIIFSWNLIPSPDWIGNLIIENSKNI